MPPRAAGNSARSRNGKRFPSSSFTPSCILSDAHELHHCRRRLAAVRALFRLVHGRAHTYNRSLPSSVAFSANCYSKSRRSLRSLEEFRIQEDELPMKRLIPFLLVAALGLAVGALLIARQLAARHARELDAQRAAWDAERADLEAALASARAGRESLSPGLVRSTPATATINVVPATAKATPEELLRWLAAMKVSPGPER